MRIAIVGGGVTGLVAAHHLHRHHQIRLYEAADRLGGHAHTVDVEVEGRTFPVDTGFIVCNDRTYPRLTALFGRLGVETTESEMSLSVADERAGVEWGTALGRMRARATHGRTRVGPIEHVAHARVLAAIPRWHRAGVRLLAELDRGTADVDETLRSFLARHRLPRSFGEAYVIPLTAAVWSADPTTVLDFPATTICRFLRNHGMLSLGERPQWRTVVGGSRTYVDAISAAFADDVRLKAPVTEIRRRPEGGVDLRVAGGEPERFDAVVLAVHAPTALAMVADADADEREVVGAVRTQPNPAVLHTDRRILPRSEAVWSSWNVRLPQSPQRAVAVTYLMNRLQPLPVSTPVCVSLNRDDDIDPDTVLGSYDYAHPVLDGPAIRAQRRLPRIQGRGGVWWAGAWTGYGFHEDGARAAEQVCERIDPGEHAMVSVLDPAPTPSTAVAATSSTGLRSCLYEGTIGHQRKIDVGHGFSQPIVLAYLDLAELDTAFAAHPLWSTTRPAPVRFRRSDMHGDPSVPLDAAVRTTLAAGLGSAPAGPIRVLTHLRHWGWTFNPISLYFAFDESDTHVEAVLAEVTNTPWHERHAYALAVPPPAEAETTGVRFAKELHVSPFMDLALDHVLRFSPPGADRLTVEMDDRTQDDTDALVFSARMVLTRRPLDRTSMTHVLRHHRLPSHRVSAGIHLNALRLWRKGAPFRRHPHKHPRST